MQSQDTTFAEPMRKLAILDGRRIEVVLEVHEPLEGMLHVFDGDPDSGSSGALLSKAFFCSECRQIEMEFHGTAATVGPGWEDGFLGPVADVAGELWDLHHASESSSQPLPSVACAVVATDLLERIANGEKAAGADLVRLFGRQFKPNSRVTQAMLWQIEAYVVAQELPEERLHPGALLEPLVGLFDELMTKVGIADPQGVLRRIAQSPARRTALIALLTTSASETFTQAESTAASLADLLGASSDVRLVLAHAIRQIGNASVASSAPSTPTAPGLSVTRQHVWARPGLAILDRFAREAIQEAIVDGDLVRVAEVTNSLAQLGLRSLRRDCLLAASAIEASDRQALAVVLAQRLHAASGEADAPDGWTPEAIEHPRPIVRSTSQA